MNGSWGYHAQDDRWKSTEDLVHYLVRAAGYDANLLLNVGPTPEGTFQPEVFQRLAGVGEWTTRYGETVYGTRGGPMPPQDWGVMTRKGGVAYLHVLDGDAPERLILPGTEGMRPGRARIFGTGREVNVVSQPEIEIELPPEARQAVDTIVELQLA
jgi:alpha-L-fucosidase